MGSRHQLDLRGIPWTPPWTDFCQIASPSSATSSRAAPQASSEPDAQRYCATTYAVGVSFTPSVATASIVEAGVCRALTREAGLLVTLRPIGSAQQAGGTVMVGGALCWRAVPDILPAATDGPCGAVTVGNAAILTNPPSSAAARVTEAVRSLDALVVRSTAIRVRKGGKVWSRQPGSATGNVSPVHPQV